MSNQINIGDWIRPYNNQGWARRRQVIRIDQDPSTGEAQACIWLMGRECSLRSDEYVKIEVGDIIRCRPHCHKWPGFYSSTITRKVRQIKDDGTVIVRVGGVDILLDDRMIKLTTSKEQR